MTDHDRHVLISRRHPKSLPRFFPPLPITFPPLTIFFTGMEIVQHARTRTYTPEGSCLPPPPLANDILFRSFPSLGSGKRLAGCRMACAIPRVRPTAAISEWDCNLQAIDTFRRPPSFLHSRRALSSPLPASGSEWGGLDHCVAVLRAKSFKKWSGSDAPECGHCACAGRRLVTQLCL